MKILPSPPTVFRDSAQKQKGRRTAVPPVVIVSYIIYMILKPFVFAELLGGL